MAKTTKTVAQRNMEMALESKARQMAQTIVNNAFTIWGKKIASVPVEFMAIDNSYQRILSNNVKKLVQDWDNAKCTLLLVSFRDGKFYVIDGQHRTASARAKGITELPCEILTGLTREQEALIFGRQNANVKKLTPFDTFKANIANGDVTIPEVSIDVAIKNICDNYGIVVKKVTTCKSERALRSVYVARNIVKSKGVECFDWMMKTITSTNWKDCSDAYCDNVITALASYYDTNKLWIDNATSLCKDVMNEISPDKLMVKAKYLYPDYGRRVAIPLCFNALVNDKSKQQ